jgi:hypothetical protein
VRERRFTGWSTIDVKKNQVVLSLLVHPKRGSGDLGDYGCSRSSGPLSLAFVVRSRSAGSSSSVPGGRGGRRHALPALPSSYR